MIPETTLKRGLNCMKDAQETVLQPAPKVGICIRWKQRGVGRFSRLILLLFSATASFLLSQPDPAAKSTAPPIVPAQDLDFSGRQLPSNFRAVDPNELYKAVSGTFIAPEKSQFETTAQYQARIEAYRKKVFFKGLTADDDFAFVLRPTSRSITGVLPKQHDYLTTGFVETEYDADSKQMSITIPTDEGESTDDLYNKKCVTAIHRWVTYGEPYKGQTAFGVIRPVRVVRVDTIEVDWTDWLPELSLTVEPEQAHILTRDIEIIMIGNLRAPFVSHWVEKVEPSLEQIEPTDIRRLHRILYINLDQLMIGDSRTGAILKHFTLPQ